jgi:hypothetical protein
MILAHIAGVPIEETVLSLGPVIAAGGWIAALNLRERFARERHSSRLRLPRGDNPGGHR